MFEADWDLPIQGYVRRVSSIHGPDFDKDLEPFHTGHAAYMSSGFDGSLAASFLPTGDPSQSYRKVYISFSAYNNSYILSAIRCL